MACLNTVYGALRYSVCCVFFPPCAPLPYRHSNICFVAMKNKLDCPPQEVGRRVRSKNRALVSEQRSEKETVARLKDETMETKRLCEKQMAELEGQMQDLRFFLKAQQEVSQSIPSGNMFLARVSIPFSLSMFFFRKSHSNYALRCRVC